MIALTIFCACFISWLLYLISLVYGFKNDPMLSKYGDGKYWIEAKWIIPFVRTRKLKLMRSGEITYKDGYSSLGYNNYGFDTKEEAINRIEEHHKWRSKNKNNNKRIERIYLNKKQKSFNQKRASQIIEELKLRTDKEEATILLLDELEKMHN